MIHKVPFSSNIFFNFISQDLLPNQVRRIIVISNQNKCSTRKRMNKWLDVISSLHGNFRFVRYGRSNRIQQNNNKPINPGGLSNPRLSFSSRQAIPVSNLCPEVLIKIEQLNEGRKA